MLKISTLRRPCAISLTTCCLTRIVVQGIPASTSAMCIVVIGVGGCLLLSTRNSLWSWFFVSRGRTRSFFLGVRGVSGISRVSQKFSASMPDMYPCRVIGADSEPCSFIFSLPLSCVPVSACGFILQINVWGVAGGCFTGVFGKLHACPVAGDFSCGKFSSVGCNSSSVSVCASEVPLGDGGSLVRAACSVGACLIFEDSIVGFTG